MCEAASVLAEHEHILPEHKCHRFIFRQNPDSRDLFLHLAYAKGLLGDEEGEKEARRHAN